MPSLGVRDAGELDGGVHGLGAAAGQEDPAAGDRGQRDEPISELLDGGVRELLEAVVGLQLLHLLGHGVGDLFAPVTDVAVPEGGEPIDVPPPVLFPDGRALASHDPDELGGRGLRERVQEGAHHQAPYV